MHSAIVAGSRRRGGGGGGGGSPSARHWRLTFPLANTSFLGLSDIELRETVGGVDATGSGTATASSGTAAEAFDPVGAGTTWTTPVNAGSRSWIAYDFGSAISINEVAIRASTSTTATPRHIVLQHSDDGVTWTDALYWYGYGSWTSQETKIFNAANAVVPVAGTAISWRLRFTTNNGGGSFTSITELNFRESAGGPETDTGGFPFTSPGGNNPSNVFDESTATHYLCNPAVPGDVAYVFPNAITVVEVAVLVNRSATEAPKDFTIQYSHNARDWTTLWAEGPITGWAPGVVRTFTKPA